MLVLSLLVALASVGAAAHSARTPFLDCAGRDSANPSARSGARVIGSRVVEQMQAGDFVKAGADFSERLAHDIPPDRLKETWASLVTALGQPKSVDSAVVDSTPASFVVRRMIHFTAIPIEASMTIDGACKVSSLSLAPAKR